MLVVLALQMLPPMITVEVAEAKVLLVEMLIAVPVVLVVLEEQTITAPE